MAMKNPYLSAVTAFVYVLGVAAFLQSTSTLFGAPPAVVGVALMLSVLVFSVALMGFLFFFTPLCLVVQQQYEASALFFLKTLGTFGVLTVLLLCSFVVW